MEEIHLVQRQDLRVDIVCVGFGPATAGFLLTLTRALQEDPENEAFQSKAIPGLPLQILCYERADDVGFGVSGVVTRARGIKETFPTLNIDEIPFATPVKKEELVYLLDPIGASRRPFYLKLADKIISAAKKILTKRSDYAFSLPIIPPFLSKHGGLLLAIGQFNQWVASQITATGLVQIWPGTPVAEPLFSNGSVRGVRLLDQGVTKEGNPTPLYLPGMDIVADLTVVGDGPVGAIGRQIEERVRGSDSIRDKEWAIGMKMVVDLPATCQLEPGTVIHTFGYPEPEIFGFLYVYKEKCASLGIFVPSWFYNPVRSAYRYLQHWMMHPYLWQHLEGGVLRSWGAKTLFESGKQKEPILVGDGFARIGEGSGSTNVLTGSGVDEAWTTGVLLGKAVIELLKERRPFTKEHLTETYVKFRQNSWIERDANVAKNARNGFEWGFLMGLIGMSLAGFTRGVLHIPKRKKRRVMPPLADFFEGRISKEEIHAIKQECYAKGISLHDALMTRSGWPEIKYDGKLLVSHQDALLLGGKVQAPDNYADHVIFLYPELCDECGVQLCAEMCSGQAITPNPDGGRPNFDREKCVHCGACLWNCMKNHPTAPEKTVIDFRVGAGGLHSAEN